MHLHLFSFSTILSQFAVKISFLTADPTVQKMETSEKEGDSNYCACATIFRMILEHLHNDNLPYLHHPLYFNTMLITKCWLFHTTITCATNNGVLKVHFQPRILSRFYASSALLSLFTASSLFNLCPSH